MMYPTSHDIKVSPSLKVSLIWKGSTDQHQSPSSMVSYLRQFRLVSLQLLSAAGKSILMVFLRAESDKPQLRRFMQRQRNQMQTCHIQRLRKRILQVMQLQKLSKRPILQWYA